MIGKVNDDFFQRHVLTKLGKLSDQVIIGPHMGVDAAILKVPDGYMAIAEDPIFPSINMTADDFAFVTVHIGASDVAVMGIRPQYMTYSLLLPPDTSEKYIADLIASISKYAAALNITIVGGHTGFYGAVTVPTIGGITVWGISPAYISPMGAKEGDAVVITKGCGVEAAALLSFELKDVLKGHIAEDDLQRAMARMHEVSVVKDAAIAACNPGVHAMHDATEGGVKRGVWEIVQASEKGVKIDTDKLLLPQDIVQVCSYFQLNPWEIISEGTLVLTCAPDQVDALLAAYTKENIDAQVIGAITAKEKGCVYTEDGQKKILIPPARDVFWDVFFNAAELHRNGPLLPEEKMCYDLKQAVQRLCDEKIENLLPEIGANIAYAPQGGTSIDNVAGIPGRIIRIKDKSVVVGEPQQGGSTHMAGTILCIQRYFPEACCVMNLRHTEHILNQCHKAGLCMVSMPLPKGYWQKGNEFFVDLETLLAHCQKLPDVIITPDRINLEKLILIVGTSLPDLIQKVLSCR